jgi:putative Mn2+ efflux pump MntP
MAGLIIGLTSFVITAAGFFLGRKAGTLLGQRAKIIGGVILIGIGIKIVVTHLSGIG